MAQAASSSSSSSSTSPCRQLQGGDEGYEYDGYQYNGYTHPYSHPYQQHHHHHHHHQQQQQAHYQQPYQHDPYTQHPQQQQYPHDPYAYDPYFHTSNLYQPTPPIDPETALQEEAIDLAFDHFYDDFMRAGQSSCSTPFHRNDAVIHYQSSPGPYGDQEYADGDVTVQGARHSRASSLSLPAKLGITLRKDKDLQQYRPPPPSSSAASASSPSSSSHWNSSSSSHYGSDSRAESAGSSVELETPRRRNRVVDMPVHASQQQQQQQQQHDDLRQDRYEDYFASSMGQSGLGTSDTTSQLPSASSQSSSSSSSSTLASPATAAARATAHLSLNDGDATISPSTPKKRGRKKGSRATALLEWTLTGVPSPRRLRDRDEATRTSPPAYRQKRQYIRRKPLEDRARPKTFSASGDHGPVSDGISISHIGALSHQRLVVSDASLRPWLLALEAAPPRFPESHCFIRPSSGRPWNIVRLESLLEVARAEQDEECRRLSPLSPTDRPAAEEQQQKQRPIPILSSLCPTSAPWLATSSINTRYDVSLQSLFPTVARQNYSGLVRVQWRRRQESSSGLLITSQSEKADEEREDEEEEEDGDGDGDGDSTLLPTDVASARAELDEVFKAVTVPAPRAPSPSASVSGQQLKVTPKARSRPRKLDLRNLWIRAVERETAHMSAAVAGLGLGVGFDLPRAGPVNTGVSRIKVEVDDEMPRVGEVDGASASHTGEEVAEEGRKAPIVLKRNLPPSMRTPTYAYAAVIRPSVNEGACF